jgi:outer membrane protein OmpA-like peptidoglycan-associated protein
VVTVAAAVGAAVWWTARTPDPVVVWGTGGDVTPPRDSTLYTAPAAVLFDTGSSVLNPPAVPALRSVVEDIRRSRSSGRIWVQGFTDDVGGDDDNLALSAARARTVAQWLVDNAAFPRSRISVVGYGEGSPAQPNDSDAHRQANRRVVIAVEQSR